MTQCEIHRVILHKTIILGHHHENLKPHLVTNNTDSVFQISFCKVVSKINWETCISSSGFTVSCAIHINVGTFTSNILFLYWRHGMESHGWRGQCCTRVLLPCIPFQSSVVDANYAQTPFMLVNVITPTSVSSECLSNWRWKHKSEREKREGSSHETFLLRLQYI